MKSTYELLSIYLDRQPIPKEIPKIIKESQLPQCSEIEYRYNLLDLPVCCRKISGIKLLSFDSAYAIFDIIGELVNCREIVIMCHVFLEKIGQRPISQRCFSVGELPNYSSIEWQAKALCGELMMPYEETAGLSAERIVEIYGVSKGQAQYRCYHY